MLLLNSRNFRFYPDLFCTRLVLQRYRGAGRWRAARADDVLHDLMEVSQSFLYGEPMLRDGTRLRRDWRGRLVLQVREERRALCPYTFDEHVLHVWRDATLEDLFKLVRSAQ